MPPRIFPEHSLFLALSGMAECIHESHTCQAFIPLLFTHILGFLSKPLFPNSDFLNFIFFPNLDRLGIPEIIKFCLFLINSSLFNFFFPWWIFTISGKKKPGCYLQDFAPKSPQLIIQVYWNRSPAFDTSIGDNAAKCSITI